MFIIEPNGNFPYMFNDQRVQQLEICQCLQETSSGGHPGKNRENAQKWCIWDTEQG